MPRMLITGGASGLGAACVELAVTQGWAVDVLDLHDPGLPEGGPAVWTRLDLADRERRDAWIESTLAGAVAYDGAIFAAGIQLLEDRLQWDDAVWQRTLAVNLIAPAHLTVGLGPRWRDGTGIVLFGSIAAEDGSTLSPAYAASKAGLVGFMNSALRWFDGRGIRINVLHPGGFDTPLSRRMRDEAPRDSVVGTPSFQRPWMPPAYAAQAAMALVTSPGVSGVALRVDDAARVTT